MENLSPKIVGIYHLHSTALAIDKWYNSVQFKLPSSFLQAWDWQCDNCGGVTGLKNIFSCFPSTCINVKSVHRNIYPVSQKIRTPYSCL